MAAPTQQTANGGIFTANVEIDNPYKFPISVYAGYGVLKNQQSTLDMPNGHDISLKNNTTTRVLWNAGVALTVIPTVLKVYAPIAYSKNIQDEVNARGLNFGQTIMFEFNLNMANPFDILKHIGE
jgi:hypothetical protein